MKKIDEKINVTAIQLRFLKRNEPGQKELLTREMEDLKTLRKDTFERLKSTYVQLIIDCAKFERGCRFGRKGLRCSTYTEEAKRQMPFL